MSPRRDGSLGTTDTVATETLAEHQLSRRKGGQLFMPAWGCSCGRVGDESWGPLHLVEMGVEAGVAAIMELHAAQADSDARELTREELAERDLAGYINGMEARYRTNPREPFDIEDTGWRDQLGILIPCAADTSVMHPEALKLGAKLWVELEDWETHQVSVVHPHQDEPTVAVAEPPTQPCFRTTPHSGHRWGMATGELGAEGHDAWCPGWPQLMAVHCSARSRHDAHTWPMDQSPADSPAPVWVPVQCDGSPGGHGWDMGTDDPRHAR